MIVLELLAVASSAYFVAAAAAACQAYPSALLPSGNTGYPAAFWTWRCLHESLGGPTSKEFLGWVAPLLEPESDNDVLPPLSGGLPTCPASAGSK